jgi:hypothetical protein
MNKDTNRIMLEIISMMTNNAIENVLNMRSVYGYILVSVQNMINRIEEMVNTPLTISRRSIEISYKERCISILNNSSMNLKNRPF